MPPLVIAAAIAGTAAVAGGAIISSGAKKAASTQKNAQQAQLQEQQRASQKEEIARQEAVTRKEAALTSPEIEKFGQTLEERVAGRGLIDVDALSAPSAVARRAGLEQTGAAISSAASARGLGRSTVPVSKIGQASQAAERDIAERVAQLQLIKEGQKGEAIEQFGRFAAFKRGGEFSVADTISRDANAVKNNEFATANTIASIGATEAAGQLLSSQMIAAGLIGIGEAATGAAETQATNDLLEKALSEKRTRRAAQVNIGHQLPRRALSLDPNLGGSLGGF